MNDLNKHRDNRKFHIINFNMNECARAHERHFHEKTRPILSIFNFASTSRWLCPDTGFLFCILYFIWSGDALTWPFYCCHIIFSHFDFHIKLCAHPDAANGWMDIFLFIFHSINGQYLLVLSLTRHGVLASSILTSIFYYTSKIAPKSREYSMESFYHHEQ